MPTLFERIIAREIPAEIVWEDEHAVAFRDIEPEAPVHIVIVPRTPIPGVADVPAPTEAADHTHLLNAARSVAERLGLTSYRLVVNQGEGAGQSVDHLHIHLLSGRKLSWPPG